MYGDIPKREINEQLARILRSKQFKASDCLQRFLVFAIETTLGGNAHDLTDIVLGHVVFDRDEHFDPHADSIVRTEAARLRRKLREYYETAGKNDPILFHFTEGGYVPSFTRSKAQRPLSRRTVAVLPFVNQTGDQKGKITSSTGSPTTSFTPSAASLA